MGVLDLFYLINGKDISFSDIKSKTVGIDMSFIIYCCSLGLKNTSALTDTEGKSTVLLYLLINKLVSYKKHNNIIAIFDNPIPNILKIEEHKKRNITRQKNIDKKISENKSIDTIEFRITPELIAEVKFILESLGISHCTADVNIEAEKLGSCLLKNGIIDYFITNDSDALPFGSTNILRYHTQNGVKKYSLYELKTVLNDLNVNYEEFVKLCVILGCDFCKKTPRIGLKTILKKYKDTILTPEQIIAYNYFIQDTIFDPDSIVKIKSNVPKFIDYLENRGFKRNEYEYKLRLF